MGFVVLMAVIPLAIALLCKAGECIQCQDDGHVNVALTT